MDFSKASELNDGSQKMHRCSAPKPLVVQTFPILVENKVVYIFALDDNRVSIYVYQVYEYLQH